MSVCCLSPGLLVESPTCGLASLWHLLFIQIQQQVFCELDLTLCSLSVWSFLSSLANLVLCVGYLLSIRLYCIYLIDYLRGFLSVHFLFHTPLAQFDLFCSPVWDTVYTIGIIKIRSSIGGGPMPRSSQ